MTFPEFEKFQDALWDQVKHMRDTKGKEYANSENRFANFDRLAEQLGLTNVQVGWVYTTKHLDAIAQYCRTQKQHSSEGIMGRIVDAITYLTLIAGMIEESHGSAQTNPMQNAATQARGGQLGTQYVWNEGMQNMQKGKV